MTDPRRNAIGIGFVLAGVGAISVNDLFIKMLSGDYPLHEMVFVRSAIGIVFTVALIRMERAGPILRVSRPGLHLLRGLLIVLANMTFFTALAVLPLAEATALFFAAPLFITLLSVPLLGERVGPLRLSAVAIGFAGVLLMQRPWAGTAELEVSRWVLALPVAAALLYALNQLLTRRLGALSAASVLSFHIQAMFILVAACFWIVAGDGRFADGVENDSIVFLLRAWVWPDGPDIWLFLGLGLNSAIIGYCLSQAYRMADAAAVAPFEYVGLPLAVFWGWLIFAELPDWEVWAGILLILGAGLAVFLRERQIARRRAAV